MKALLSPYHPVHIALGLVLWSLWFVAIYGGLSVACSLAPPEPQHGAWTWINGLLVLFSLLTLLVLGALAWWCWRAGQLLTLRPRERFVALLSAGTHAVAAVATLFITLPVLALPPCV
ncbi:hypothetical protein ACX0MV_09440 [Pseudomonas borbori]